MSLSSFDLKTLQCWMQAVMLDQIPRTQPINHGADAPRSPVIEDIITASRQQTSRERLDVYCNAYLARLLECLRDEFATLCQFLGEDVFHALAAAYLQACPSHSYTLSNLGARFPGYLRDSAEAFEGAQFLIDLAKLERVYAEVFDGPGIEGMPPITEVDLSGIRPDTWPEVRFEPAPCLRLLQLDYPVHEFITACRHGSEPPIPDPAPTWLAITRRQYIVRRIPLSESQFRLLSRLAEGCPLGRALERVASSQDDLESFANEIQVWFRDWTAAGFFTAIRPSG